MSNKLLVACIGTGVFLAAWVLLPPSLHAQETKGAPQVLIGRWGNSPQECRSYHRKSDGITIINKNNYSFCGGSGCEATIIKSRKTHDGYVLSLVSRGNPDGWQSRVRVIDDKVIEMVGAGLIGRDETLVRCSKSDAIAGIGLRSDSTASRTKSLDGIFAAYYALAIPTRCSQLAPDISAAETIIKTGKLMWERHIQEWVRRDGLDHQTEALLKGLDVVDSEKQRAEYAVRADAAEIKNFCDEVLNAFGNDGRILPNLIKDPRRKS